MCGSLHRRSQPPKIESIASTTFFSHRRTTRFWVMRKARNIEISWGAKCHWHFWHTLTSHQQQNKINSRNECERNRWTVVDWWQSSSTEVDINWRFDRTMIEGMRWSMYTQNLGGFWSNFLFWWKDICVLDYVVYMKRNQPWFWLGDLNVKWFRLMISDTGWKLKR